MNSSPPNPKFYLRIWFVYPLLYPFYLMGKTAIAGKQNLESGVPQIADYWMLGILGLVFFRLPVRLLRPAVGLVCVFATFVCYTILVNSSWAMVLDDASLLKSSLFYSYDIVVFVSFLLFYSAFGEAFLETVVYSVAASVVLQAILSPLALTDLSSRQPMFFNDENQLGYFCLLATIIFVSGTRRFVVPTWCQVLFYGAVAYLSVLSQCRSALSALAVLAVVSLLGRPIRLLFVLGVLAAGYLVMTLEPELISTFGERFVTPGEYDTLSTRGYDRIFNHPEHILVGAGEGAYTRFHSDLFGTELHSSYGTLLFCYGIPGVALFTFGLFLIARSDWKSALFLLPPFVYGSAHHGLRFAFFWTMLAFLCCMALHSTPNPDAAAELTVSTPPDRAAPPDCPAEAHPEFAQVS
jgi:hypothetical protein